MLGLSGLPRHPRARFKEDNWVKFYVLKDGKFLSDENGARDAIKQATGVELPALRTEDSTVSVETEIDLEEDLDFLASLSKQPDDKMIGLQARMMKEQLETSPEEFNLGNLGYTLSSNEEIIEIINTLAENF